MAQRASDADREQALRVLSESYAAGRLTAAELNARSDAAATARTLTELDELLADLPGPPAAPPGWGDRGLRTHAALFAAGSAALVVAWLLTRDPTPAPTDQGSGYYWPVWIALAWAFALVLHGLHAFGRIPTPRRPAAEPPTPAPPTARLEQLTTREREILALVGHARSNKQIALELTISERTARTHVSNILRKLDLTSRTEAALLAERAGLVRDMPDGDRGRTSAE
jgi:DNA-binding CsgD family transcriptional regulator